MSGIVVNSYVLTRVGAILSASFAKIYEHMELFCFSHIEKKKKEKKKKIHTQDFVMVAVKLFYATKPLIIPTKRSIFDVWQDS